MLTATPWTLLLNHLQVHIIHGKIQLPLQSARTVSVMPPQPDKNIESLSLPFAVQVNMPADLKSAAKGENLDLIAQLWPTCQVVSPMVTSKWKHLHILRGKWNILPMIKCLITATTQDRDNFDWMNSFKTYHVDKQAAVKAYEPHFTFVDGFISSHTLMSHSKYCEHTSFCSRLITELSVPSCHHETWIVQHSNIPMDSYWLFRPVVSLVNKIQSALWWPETRLTIEEAHAGKGIYCHSDLHKCTLFYKICWSWLGIQGTIFNSLQKCLLQSFIITDWNFLKFFLTYQSKFQMRWPTKCMQLESMQPKGRHHTPIAHLAMVKIICLKPPQHGKSNAYWCKLSRRQYFMSS